jgi:hypothetical protein
MRPHLCPFTNHSFRFGVPQSLKELSSPRLFVTGKKAAVVRQLDRPQRLVVAEFVAGAISIVQGPVVLPLLLYKFVDSAHKWAGATLLG